MSVTTLPTTAALITFLAVMFPITAQSLSLNRATSTGPTGITMWIAYDNTDRLNPVTGARNPLDVDEIIRSIDTVPGLTGTSCGPTNKARLTHGAPPSPSSCPNGASECTGREKITGDVKKFAEYIFESTHGTHFIKRVYVADRGRAWKNADVRWNMSTGVSSAWLGDWKVIPGTSFVNTSSPSIKDRGYLRLQSAERNCIHDVLHHEFGHYFYNLPDRYVRDKDQAYYKGYLPRYGRNLWFPVGVLTGDPNTVMNSNFPHRFVDRTNARITVDYQHPVSGHLVVQTLTPDVLDDHIDSNDGPYHLFRKKPFALDEWSLIREEHSDLNTTIFAGGFSAPDPSQMPRVDIQFVGDQNTFGNTDVGSVLLVDRSGSMRVTTNGIAASQFVQEASLFLLHSSRPTDLVGSYLYNQSIEALYAYATYGEHAEATSLYMRRASGNTNIHQAMSAAMDALVQTHGQEGVAGADIFLMSDGRQTVGRPLWEQVRRANSLGIRVHTMAFGNSDLATMLNISNYTNGRATQLAGRGDAEELKIAMIHWLSEGRGFRTVYLVEPELYEWNVRDRTAEVEGSFVVPKKSDNLLFYTFLNRGDSSQYSIELTAPDNTVVIGNADSVAQLGRFNGLQIEYPQPGEWRYRLVGAVTGTGMKIIAYVRNPELDVEVSFVVPTSQGHVGAKVEAQIFGRYPLTDVEVRAYLYVPVERQTNAGGRQLEYRPVEEIDLYDDGDHGGDETHGDGVYTGIVSTPLGFRKIRLDARFVIGPTSRPANNAPYESGTTYEILRQDYNSNAKFDEGFEAWATRYVDFGE